jgi:glutaredoxin
MSTMRASGIDPSIRSRVTLPNGAGRTREETTMALQLYHRWHCPYSARVRDFVDAHDLGGRIEYIELTEVPDAEAKLADLTGGGQVPCLVIDGQPKLESAAIVEWLDENLVKSKA